MTAEASLQSLVARAGARAFSNNRPVLASRVERVRSIDPLEALESVASVSRTNPIISVQAGIRSYWTRPADGFTLAGAGSAVSFAPSGSTRFAEVDAGWTQLLKDAVIDDPSSGTPGAGPTLIGGFAFDPERPHSEAWSDFPDARLTVSLLQLVARAGDCWLTTSVLVDPDGTPRVDLSLIGMLRDALLNDTKVCLEDDGAPADSGFICTDTRNADAWRATVRYAVNAIRSGTMEKVVIAREVRASATTDLDVAEILRQLRYEHPGCYVFGFWHGGSAFVGATPERLVRVDAHEVQASSLAGSVRRGATPSEDADRAQELFASAKDRSEHEIVRRTLCAGLARFCDDVTAADMPTLLSLPQVHHLHTAVHARLRAGHTILQIIAELHPTPAVGGSPRDAALRFIRNNEKMDRGWYAGPVGWMQWNRGEFAVALRSALVSGSDALLFAGCGVVADSVPNTEYAESLLKLRPMQGAITASLASALAARDFDAEIAQASAFTGDTL